MKTLSRKFFRLLLLTCFADNGKTCESLNNSDFLARYATQSHAMTERNTPRPLLCPSPAKAAAGRCFSTGAAPL